MLKQSSSMDCLNMTSSAIPLPELLSELAAKQWQRLLERADAGQQALFMTHQPILLRLPEWPETESELQEKKKN
ncbi:MAG: hypothetical protein E6Q86_02805, partial [Tolumonas sp.]